MMRTWGFAGADGSAGADVSADESAGVSANDSAAVASAMATSALASALRRPLRLGPDAFGEGSTGSTGIASPAKARSSGLSRFGLGSLPRPFFRMPSPAHVEPGLAPAIDCLD
jgi:hypothetical protein